MLDARCYMLYVSCTLNVSLLFREPMSPNFQLSQNVTENPSKYMYSIVFVWVGFVVVLVVIVSLNELENF